MDAEMAAPPQWGDPPLSAQNKREIGGLAVWSVTSAKPGHGVECLRDNSTETYWQSDGAQPHVVSIAFQRKVELLELGFYMDFKLDESYTPKTCAVRVGNNLQDMKEVRSLDLPEPAGWIYVRLKRPGESADVAGLRAYLVQLVVQTNHQNGRDTHVRQIKIFGPRKDMVQAVGHEDITTVGFSQYAVVR